jgi:hypothetical protein
MDLIVAPLRAGSTKARYDQVVDWHAFVVDGVTYHWTSYPSHYRVGDGPEVPCVALSVRLHPDGGGGVGNSFPADATVTEVDAIELVRAFLDADRGPFPGSPVSRFTSLVPFAFDATYEDAAGRESIVIRVVRRTWGKGNPSGYAFETTLRGVAFDGVDLETLSPVDAPDEWLENFLLAGALPCAITVHGKCIRTALHFTLDLRGANAVVTVRMAVAGETCEVADESFEGALLRLDRVLPAGARLTACVTCLYSDYSPKGGASMRMSCHRDSKEKYLAVRTKEDFLAVPTTEDVMETHLCEEYRLRVPGTGYRG